MKKEEAEELKAKLEEMKIRGEQKELAAERDQLEKTLKSRQRLTTLIKKEIQDDAETYGDERRSPIVERESAQALDEAELVTAEPITVVLSEKGWVRAAKGHDIEARALSYKTNDAFQAAARGKSNQLAIFMDSFGRAYSLAAHTLPSARGLGEPVAGRLTPPAGASFVGVMMGDTDDLYLMVSDAGYGFLARFGDLHTKNKAGKAALSLPKGARPLPPVPITNPETDRIAAATSEGRLLIIPARELPELAKGKGIKIIGIPPARVAAREEFVQAVTIIPAGGKLTVYSGQRHTSIKAGDMEHYYGERGRRGLKLPRGFQRVDRLEIQDQ